MDALVSSIYICKFNECEQVYKSAHASYIIDRSGFINPVGEDALQIFSRGVREHV